MTPRRASGRPPFTGVTGAGNKSYAIAPASFSTLVAWEACTDGGAAPDCGRHDIDLIADNRSEVGVVYADGSAYTPVVGNPAVNFAGATTGPDHSVTLTVDYSEPPPVACRTWARQEWCSTTPATACPPSAFKRTT